MTAAAGAVAALAAAGEERKVIARLREAGATSAGTATDLDEDGLSPSALECLRGAGVLKSGPVGQWLDEHALKQHEGARRRKVGSVLKWGGAVAAAGIAIAMLARG